MTDRTWKRITIDAELPIPGTEESDYLHFKAMAWKSNDDGAREIARDVAQFANHLGGSIIVGAVDDGHDRLTGYVTVQEPNEVAQRVADVCHASLSPRVELHPVVIKTSDAKEILVLNVAAHPGVVAIRLKGVERWEFYKRDGKSKRPISFSEVETMWTNGRKGRLLLLKVPVDPAQSETRHVLVDAVAADSAFLRDASRLVLHDDCFELELKNGQRFSLPYEFVRAAWPNITGQWVVSLTAKFEWAEHGQHMKVGYSP